MVAVPLLGVRMLVMTKSEFTISLMTILVAPVLEMLAASSANSSYRSSASGVTETWALEGAVAHWLSIPTSTPPEPTSPMQ